MRRAERAGEHGIECTSMTHDTLVAGIYGLGLMAISGISYGVIHRSIRHSWTKSLLIGLIFSITAILAMQQPVQLREGIMIDARAVIVGLAAAFGGLPAAILSATLVGSYRLNLGGIGAIAGATGIVACAILGQIWRRYVGVKFHTGPQQLAGLGLLLALHSLSIFLLPLDMASELFPAAIPMLIASSITGALVMGSLIERERRHMYTEDHWRHSASTDSLTGLANRRAFTTALADAPKPIDPSQACLLMIMDVDHFKLVNDTFGHDAGDEALKAVADALRQTVRPGEQICRLGGEEFAIFVPSIDPHRIYDRANLFRTAVAKNPIRYAGKPIPLTVSLGIAQRTGDHVSDIHGMMRDADLALYKAKSNGRNCVSVSNDPFSKTCYKKIWAVAG